MVKLYRGEIENTNNNTNISKDIFDKQTWSIYYGIFATEATTGILLNLMVILLYKTRAVKTTTFNYLIAHSSAAHIAQLLGAILSVMIDVRRTISDPEINNANVYYDKFYNNNS